MIVSTKGRYALRVMIDIAEHQGEGLVPLRMVAERQHISLKYLEGIVSSLVRGGLLKGSRGKGGGYSLACNPDECTLLDVLQLTEESLAPVKCLEDDAAPCPYAGACRTLPVWTELNQLVSGFFAQRTLSSLIAEDVDCSLI